MDKSWMEEDRPSQEYIDGVKDLYNLLLPMPQQKGIQYYVLARTA